MGQKKRKMTCSELFLLNLSTSIKCVCGIPKEFSFARTCMFQRSIGEEFHERQDFAHVLNDLLNLLLDELMPWHKDSYDFSLLMKAMQNM